MNMAIPLLASQRQDVNPFCFDRTSYGFCHLINTTLKGEILLQGEITRYLLFVCDGRNQYIPVQNRILVQESNGQMVLINNVIAIHSPMDHLTDEAWTVLDSIDIGI